MKNPWERLRNKDKIEALEAEVTRLGSELIEAQSIAAKEREAMARQANMIREMDQLIFQMSQCLSWDTMRPYFNQLQALQETRQKAESAMIGRLVRQRVIEVYK